VRNAELAEVQLNGERVRDFVQRMFDFGYLTKTTRSGADVYENSGPLTAEQRAAPEVYQPRTNPFQRSSCE
jgi:hypothetical protein